MLSSRLDLTDNPLCNSGLVLYTDGSSFIENGKRIAGYAVVSDSEVVGAETFPQEWSVQEVEL